MMAYWLMKSEPDVFSIDDLKVKGNKGEVWDGVRNFEARNFMQEMAVGDEAFFYHSSCKQVGIVGQMTITTAAYPDPTQFDKNSPYFDPKASLTSCTNKPRWVAVDVAFACQWQHLLSLSTIKATPKLSDMMLVTRSRLSVMPVSKAHWHTILRLSDT